MGFWATLNFSSNVSNETTLLSTTQCAQFGAWLLVFRVSKRPQNSLTTYLVVFIFWIPLLFVHLMHKENQDWACSPSTRYLSKSSRFLLNNLIPRTFTTAICTGRELGGNLCQSHLPGWGVLPEKLGGGVRPACQSPHPIYDPSLRYSLPYLWPDLTKNSKRNLHYN